ncbi:TPA: hypothetical protein N0F65_010023 [Lagenidium giganteum]|uniref:SAC3/GANP/THP3 conserved domain-containing protein n=1 Tax=Lagenidium giganteum TaxID=4803 RepID=A0AAV2ZGX8_9STRA|nr:TPA: hypothetical protein N0F65_010023 [Lagenidium giganteum]
MCAPSEQRERRRMHEMSRFEQPPPGADDPGCWMIKKYRRPAAGRVDIQVKELRPPSTLRNVLQHLCVNVLPWKACGFDDLACTDSTAHDFLALYHFISDRFRSVRQDFTIQRARDATLVAALETIARFHILAAARAFQLVPHTDQEWSDTLNDQQLASALSQLRALYKIDPTLAANEGEFVAYDVLLHLHDPNAVSLLLLNAKKTRAKQSEQMKRALVVFVAFQTQDFHRFFRVFSQMTIFEKLLLLRHLPSVWTSTLSLINKAFGKIDKFQLAELAQWTHLNDIEHVDMLCTSLNVHVERPTDAWDDQDSSKPTESAYFAKFKVNPLKEDIEKLIQRKLIVHVAAIVFTGTSVAGMTSPYLVMHGVNATS